MSGVSANSEEATLVFPGRLAQGYWCHDRNRQIGHPENTLFPYPSIKRKLSLWLVSVAKFVQDKALWRFRWLQSASRKTQLRNLASAWSSGL